jgi:hypothetical protein
MSARGFRVYCRRREYFGCRGVVQCANGKADLEQRCPEELGQEQRLVGRIAGQAPERPLRAAENACVWFVANLVGNEAEDSLRIEIEVKNDVFKRPATRQTGRWSCRRGRRGWRRGGILRRPDSGAGSERGRGAESKCTEDCSTVGRSLSERAEPARKLIKAPVIHRAVPIPAVSRGVGCGLRLDDIIIQMPKVRPETAQHSKPFAAEAGALRKRANAHRAGEGREHNAAHADAPARVKED